MIHGLQFILLRPFTWIRRWKHALKDDWGSVMLLLFLYMLQGIPLGLIAAIPLVLQEKKDISYREQAVFSFAYWPFRCVVGWRWFLKF